VFAQEAEELDGFIARGSEPVGETGVELGNLARFQGDVVIGNDQPHSPGQHVQPFVSLVGASFRLAVLRGDDDLPGLRVEAYAFLLVTDRYPPFSLK
jgi:hypothetical protein